MASPFTRAERKLITDRFFRMGGEVEPAQWALLEEQAQQRREAEESTSRG